jgi:hypothetical protein
MAKYRMDTPKGQVQFAHDNEGADAARAKAKELGVGNKIGRWLREWADTPKTTPPQGDVAVTTTTTTTTPLPRSGGRDVTPEQLRYWQKQQLGILEARKRVWAEIGHELTRNDEHELKRLRKILEPPVSVGRWQSKKKGATK